MYKHLVFMIKRFKQKVKKIGNSHFVLLPMKIIKEQNLNLNDEFDFVIRIPEGNKENVNGQRKERITTV